MPNLLQTNALIEDIKEHFPLYPLQIDEDLRSENGFILKRT